MDDGLNGHKIAGRHVGMITFTAPGVNEHQGVNFVGGQRPPGICPCTSSMSDPGLWNASAGRRWNHLRTLMKRAWPDLDFFRAAEFQVRGLIHLHVPVASSERLDLNAIRMMALAAGFGCSTQFNPDVSPGYLAKYVSKSLDTAGTMPWSEVDVETGEVVPVLTPRLRTWSCSRGWGVTMKEMREVCRTQATKRAALQRDSLPDGGIITAGDRVGAHFPGPTDSG